MNPAFLKINDLELHYPKFSLGPINLDILRDECVGIVGPNGSGKTTLLGTMMGMKQSSSGSVQVGGSDESRIRMEHLGIVKETHLPLDATADDLIRLECAYIESFNSELALTRLEEREIDRTRTIAQLSRGQVVLLQWILALSRTPDYFILDEPFTGLDPIARKRVIAWLQEAQVNGSGYIFSSHSLLELDSLVDRIVMLSSGKVVMDIVKPSRRSKWWHYTEGTLSGAESVDGSGTIWIAREGDVVDEFARPIGLDDVFQQIHEAELDAPMESVRGARHLA